MKAKSVRKKMKQKSFAAAVKREDIVNGAEDLGVELNEHIQFVIDGADSIGWLPAAECQRIATPYDGGKDVGFYYDRPQTWVLVPAGYFAVFFPQDAHAPLAVEATIRKAVVKVLATS